MRFILLLLSTTIAVPSLASEPGTYRPGTPYETTVASNADVCEQQCSGDAQCRSWNYVKINARSAGICEFQSEVGKAVPSAMSVSGVNASSRSTRSSQIVQGNTRTTRVGQSHLQESGRSGSDPALVKARHTSHRPHYHPSVPTPQPGQPPNPYLRPQGLTPQNDIVRSNMGLRPMLDSSSPMQPDQTMLPGQPAVPYGQPPRPSISPGPAYSAPQPYGQTPYGQPSGYGQMPQTRSRPSQPSQYRPSGQPSYPAQPSYRSQPQTSVPSYSSRPSSPQTGWSGPGSSQGQVRSPARQSYPPQHMSGYPPQDGWTGQYGGDGRPPIGQTIPAPNSPPAYAPQPYAPQPNSPQPYGSGQSVPQPYPPSSAGSYPPDYMTGRPQGQGLYGNLYDDEVRVPTANRPMPMDPNVPVATSERRPVRPVQQSPLGPPMR